MSKKFIITENERREIRKLYRLSEDYSLTDAEKSIAAKFWGLDKPDDEDVTTDVPSESGKTDSEEVEKSSGDTQDVRIENGKVKITGDFKSEQLSNINFLIDEMNKAGITDPYAQVGILSVIKKESGFIPKSEVSYSKTSNERLRKLFGKRLRKYSESELDELKKDDRQFYNVIYAKTVGNQGGDDGYNYRGRGFNGITFKSGYERMQKVLQTQGKLNRPIDIVQNPDQLNEIDVAAEAAVLFFINAANNETMQRKYGLKDINQFKDQQTALKGIVNINAGLGNNIEGNYLASLEKATQWADKFKLDSSNLA
jgi:predicted chitinase